MNRDRSAWGSRCGACAILVLLVAPLAACVASHPPGPGSVDGPDDGGAPAPDDGGAPAPRDDAAVRCGPRTILQEEDTGMDGVALGSDGRIAITWTHRTYTGDAVEERAFIEIIGLDGTSDVVAREIGEEGTLVPLGDGYAQIGWGAPGTVHLLDHDGASAREPIAIPGWYSSAAHLAASGRVLRGAWTRAGGGEQQVHDLDLSAPTPTLQTIADASGAVVARTFRRELQAVGSPVRALVERTLPDGTLGPELAWPESIEPVAAQLHAGRGEWIVLGLEHVPDETGSLSIRPALVAVPRDGSGVRVTSITDAGSMRTVSGSVAVGPDAALFAIDDYHGVSFVARLELDSMEVSARMALEYGRTGHPLWHEATGGFALVTEARAHGEGRTEIVFRCGL